MFTSYKVIFVLVIKGHFILLHKERSKEGREGGRRKEEREGGRQEGRKEGRKEGREEERKASFIVPRPLNY